jgi:hypothetical protein
MKQLLFLVSAWCVATTVFGQTPKQLASAELTTPYEEYTNTYKYSKKARVVGVPYNYSMNDVMDLFSYYGSYWHKADTTISIDKDSNTTLYISEYDRNNRVLNIKAFYNDTIYAITNNSFFNNGNVKDFSTYNIEWGIDTTEYNKFWYFDDGRIEKESIYTQKSSGYFYIKTTNYVYNSYKQLISSYETIDTIANQNSRTLLVDSAIYTYNDTLTLKPSTKLLFSNEYSGDTLSTVSSGYTTYYEYDNLDRLLADSVPMPNGYSLVRYTYTSDTTIRDAISFNSLYDTVARLVNRVYKVSDAQNNQIFMANYNVDNNTHTLIYSKTSIYSSDYLPQAEL